MHVYKIRIDTKVSGLHKYVIFCHFQNRQKNYFLFFLKYFAKPYLNRGLHPSFYEDQLKKSKINYKIFDEVNGAYLSAKQNLKNGEIIFIGGSNFVVGEFLEKNLQK